MFIELFLSFLKLSRPLKFISSFALKFNTAELKLLHHFKIVNQVELLVQIFLSKLINYSMAAELILIARKC
jgi:hypothetical protein